MQLVAPTEGMYCPTAQFVQRLAAESEKLPTAQATQTVSPRSPANLPAAQLVQLVAPVLGCTQPAAQTEQAATLVVL